MTCPAAHLVLGLAVATGLALIPLETARSIQTRTLRLLRPGQQAMTVLRQWAGTAAAAVRSHLATARRLQETERALAELRQANRRLAARLAAAEARAAHGSPARGPGPSGDALLTARWVPARVLGSLARSYLHRRHLLDVGARSGIQPETLVLQPTPAVLDQGRNAGLESDQLVLQYGSVWGKIVDVGPQTSTVRTVTEPGYRDVVRLVPDAGPGRPGGVGPRGVLEGTGERLVRVRLVPASEAVRVGDRVYSEAARAVLAEPPYYGQVVRAERPVGASHWEIWVEPAAPSDPADPVAVLRIRPSPLRRAERNGP